MHPCLSAFCIYWYISYCTLLQGFLPGIFGVSHGALQFMAYEELKKLTNRYHGNVLNKKLVSFFCCLTLQLCADFGRLLCVG